MGVTDKRWFRLTCAKCGAAETLAVLDKGSGWSRSHWQGLPTVERFKVENETRAGDEPEITAAICKVCGLPARVETSYGFKAPEGW